MYKHPGYEVQFILKAPANCDMDLGDRWFDLMSYINDYNEGLEESEKVTFLQKIKTTGDKWKLVESEKSFAHTLSGRYCTLNKDGSITDEGEIQIIVM